MRAVGHSNSRRALPRKTSRWARTATTGLRRHRNWQEPHAIRGHATAFHCDLAANTAIPAPAGTSPPTFIALGRSNRWFDEAGRSGGAIGRDGVRENGSVSPRSDDERRTNVHRSCMQQRIVAIVATLTCIKQPPVAVREIDTVLLAQCRSFSTMPMRAVVSAVSGERLRDWRIRGIRKAALERIR